MSLAVARLISQSKHPCQVPPRLLAVDHVPEIPSRRRVIPAQRVRSKALSSEFPDSLVMEEIVARVYVAGPYTKGDVAVNVRNAYEAANRLADLGFAPFVPHATHFWHMLFPRPYEFWLELDNQFLPCCAAVLRLPGASNGADKEVQLAEALGIPVFTEIDRLVEWFKTRTSKKSGT